MIKHLALVMDGNRRWAKNQGLNPWIGHSRGMDAVKHSVEFCIEKKIPHLSLYVFSLENFKRSPQEIGFLFDLLVNEGAKWVDELVKNSVRIRFLGDRTLFPKHVVPTIERMEQTTAQGTALETNLLFCYGAQQEIINGIKKIAQQFKQGLIKEDEIDDALLRSHFWMQKTPDPDLIIRTGGRQRLSNFLLYQAAYSEIHFLDCLWPNIKKEDLAQVLEKFEVAQRNFGI